MATIIAGQYDTFDDAGRATDRLLAAGFEQQSISVFFNNAPGRHDTFPTGGDEWADPEAHMLQKGAAKGVAAGAGVGLAAAAGGPLAAAAAVGVGAYVGGLAGAASESQARDSDDPHNDDVHKVWRRPAAVMVAVALPDASREAAALDALRGTGAHNIERADGTIRDANWVDFDPLAAPKLVDEPERSAATS